MTLFSTIAHEHGDDGGKNLFKTNLHFLSSNGEEKLSEMNEIRLSFVFSSFSLFFVVEVEVE